LKSTTTTTTSTTTTNNNINHYKWWALLQLKSNLHSLLQNEPVAADPINPLWLCCSCRLLSIASTASVLFLFVVFYGAAKKHFLISHIQSTIIFTSHEIQ
jgi:hypothetical protein